MSAGRLYRVVKGKPKDEPNVSLWAKWFEAATRVVEQTTIEEVLVSTVFLGLNYNFSGKGPPVLWETIIFGGALDGKEQRYTSVKAAKEGHKKMVARVKRAVRNGTKKQ